MIELFQKANLHKDRPAIVSNGNTYSYEDLLVRSSAVAANLLNKASDLNQARIAFLVPPSFEYTAVQWGIWAAGGIAVPLCVQHPLPSMEYVIEDSGSKVIIVHKDYQHVLQPLESRPGLSIIPLEEVFKMNSSPLPDIDLHRRAMMLYTSGTTNKPKGVVTTHGIIQSQITTLVEAWEWQKDDYILNILPLHHVHGIINVLSCALWSGACCEFHAKFEAKEVWSAILSGRMTLFMAVPTIYYKLINYWEGKNKKDRLLMSEAASKLRLMVSGSAALPVPVLEKWKSITGHTLLERYGMTEIGMGLSNSYRKERRPGYVGNPLPGVELRLADNDNNPVDKDKPGEIQIKGPCVFKEYWQKEEATREAFTKDGWFRTGDIAILHNGMYKILGRDSVDIIKSGGYKISALEIEDVLRGHKDIKDSAVIGLEDEEWGQVVAACLVSGQKALDFDEISKWLRARLPAYKIPRKYILQRKLPRNVLGKVTKNELKSLF
ncbi:acyl-CoA synthetase [uncultured Eudoraea sp.]|uniref:acyl-CoA synthetase n=1 Tax=uncultured Eudoraea sp. TaxID=1035614 RepID=UPI002628BE28|nr:acyl-CoA synthetase [uncultured Eudoraea sp.]